MAQDDLQGYLKSVPTTDNVRADAWDAFNNSKDQDEFHQKVSQLPIPDDAKADLWDAKYSGKPVSVYKPPTPVHPQAPTPQASTGTRLWNWMNSPVNVGHLRDNIARHEAESTAAPSKAEVDEYAKMQGPMGVDKVVGGLEYGGNLARRFLAGFGATAAKNLVTPLGVGLTALGPLGKTPGAAGAIAKTLGVGAGAGFAGAGVKDIAHHVAHPDPNATWQDTVSRTANDLAMVAGGAAGTAAEVHEFRNGTTPVAQGPGQTTPANGQARLNQAIGTGPTPEVTRTVHVSPQMADAIDAHNANPLPGKRFIVKSTKTGKQSMTLANQNVDTGGFDYQNFRNPDGTAQLNNSISDTPSATLPGIQGPGSVPVRLSTVAGNRQTSAPGHFLSAEVVRPTAGQTPRPVEAPATIPPTPSLPEAPATPPTPLPAKTAPIEAPTVVDSKPVTATPPKGAKGVWTLDQSGVAVPSNQVAKDWLARKQAKATKQQIVTQADEARGIQEVTLPVTEGGVRPGVPTPMESANLPTALGPRIARTGTASTARQSGLLEAQTRLQELENDAPNHFGDSDFQDKLEQAKIDVHVAQGNVSQSVAKVVEAGKLVEKPVGDPEVLAKHEAAMRPLIGETMRLAQLRRGELASHAIDIAMRESRNPSGKIPDEVAKTLSDALGEKVGDTLTPAQMGAVERLRGASISEEPKITYIKRSLAEKQIAEGYTGAGGKFVKPEDAEKQFQDAQDNLLMDLQDPNISGDRQAKLTEALQPDAKGNMKYFTYDRGLEYPKPQDLPPDHPEFPFAPKALGHDITPINLKNYEAALGKQPYNLHLGTNSGNRYVAPERLAELEALKRGSTPGSTPLPEQMQELLGTKDTPDVHGMSAQPIDDTVKAGSDIAELDRQIRQEALDNRQARTLGVLKGQIGMLKDLGGPSPELRAQLDALSPDVKELLPKELFNEESTKAQSGAASTSSDLTQSAKGADKAARPTKNAAAGKPTRFEGIKTTGVEAQILEKFPDKAPDIERLQQGVVDRFDPAKRQKAYAPALALYFEKLKAGSDYALKSGLDAANTKPFNPDTTLGSGLGGFQSFVPQRVRPYSPGEVQAIAYSAADSMLGRWEDMTNAELLSHKDGLRKSSLVDAIDQASPTSNDPEEFAVQKELHDELVTRHNSLKQIVGQSTNIWDRFQDMALDHEARQAASRTLRETAGPVRRNNEIVREHFDKMDRFMNQLSEPERYRFWDSMTRGETQVDNPLTPEAVATWEKKNGAVLDPNEVARSLRSVMDAARDRVTNTSGKLENFFTDYMPGMYSNQSRAKAFSENWVGTRDLQGRTGFLKEKMYQYHEDALRAGLQPVTTNPVRAAMMITEQLNRYSMAHDLKNKYVNDNLATYYDREETPPASWEKFDDRLFNTGKGGYWAPPAVARTFNNFVSEGLSGKWKVPYTNFSMYDALRSTNNLANRMQLGFSAFHGVETMLNSGFTTMALGLKQTVNEGRIMSGLMNMAKGGTFVVPLVEDVWNGQKGLVNFRDPTKALDYAQLSNDLERANANVADPRFKLQQIERMKENFKLANDSLVPNGTRAVAGAKAALNLLGAGVETFAWPIMNGLVPRVKIGAFYKMAEQVHSEYAGSSPEVINQELQKAWDSVDNRFGQVNYQNMFMNKTVQDLATLTVRSPGWNIGTIREVGGGVLDLGKSVRDVTQGKQFKISNRTAYTGAMVMGTMMINALYQSLHSNTPPVKGMDYFFPQDGTKTVNGEANRVYPKTYVYDFINAYHDPFATAWHKAAPDISTMSDIIHNEDYYHREIRDPGSSPVDQAKQTLAFMAHQFQPFSFANLSEARLRNQTSTVESFSGILPAPRWVGRTPAENLAYTYFSNHKDAGAEDPTQLEKKRVFIELRNKVAQGQVSSDDIQQAIDSGKLSPTSVGYLYKTLNKPQIVNWTENLYNPNEVWNVWQRANTEEKKVLLTTVMSRIIKETSGKEQEDKLNELQEFSDKVGQ